jgi:hypothetical protein
MIMMKPNGPFHQHLPVVIKSLSVHSQIPAATPLPDEENN